MPKLWEDGNNVTFNCIICDQILIIIDGIVKDFHHYMNKQNPLWPKNGDGTSFISMNHIHKWVRTGPDTLFCFGCQTGIEEPEKK